MNRQVKYTSHYVKLLKNMVEEIEKLSKEEGIKQEDYS